MKRILISRTHEQLRVVCVDGQKLDDLEIEHADQEHKVARICNGEIVSIQPSLAAAFVDFGSKRNGFLPLKEIAPEYFSDATKKKHGHPNIKDVLFEGQKVLVQVNKEERGSKGAALSTYISLAGCYLVLMPNNPKAGGISRRIEGEEREELRKVLNQLKIPKDMGVIIRTGGIGKSLEELQWDLDVLVNLWEAINTASKAHGAPYLIHQESDMAIRAVRDHLRPDVAEILIDDKETYEKVHAYIERIRPAFIDRVKFYDKPVSLFSSYQIEKQIELAFKRSVRLPSGGEIVIDRTEALISIDVNSAQATKGEHIEDTALNTNLEASVEIAKQLRIRDLGGLFVIDFIDMDFPENNRKVENCMRDALKYDRARTQTGYISRFGLLEMSRQRLRPSLNEANQITCPRCHGQGTIRNIKSLALSIIHLIEEKASKEKCNQVHAQVPINVATYLVNEHRQSIDKIEKMHSVNIIVIPNPYMEPPQYEIECPTSRGKTGTGQKTLSYELAKPPAISYETEPTKQQIKRQEPAVKDVLPKTSAPISKRKKKKTDGIIKRLFGFLFKKDKKGKPQTYKRKPYDRRAQSGRKQPHWKQQPRHGYQRSRRNYREKTSSDPRTQTRDTTTPKPSTAKKQPQKPQEKRPPVVKETTKAPVKKPQKAVVKEPVKKPAEIVKAPVEKPTKTVKENNVSKHAAIIAKSVIENKNGMVQVETDPHEKNARVRKSEQEQPKEHKPAKKPSTPKKPQRKPMTEEKLVMIETKKD